MLNKQQNRPQVASLQQTMKTNQGVIGVKKMPNQTRYVTNNVIQGHIPSSKAVNDQLRSLRAELDLIRGENADYKDEIAELTDKYLREKQKCQELIDQIQRHQLCSGNQQRIIDKMVEKQVQKTELDNIRRIQEQEKMLEKYKKYKLCLSKNVYDLQERLKATRQELQFMQRQLIQYQQHGAPQQKTSKPFESLTLNKNNSNKSSGSRKSNKIMDFDELRDQPSQQLRNEPKQSARGLKYRKTSEELQEIEIRQLKSSKKARNGLMVAKSLAVNRGETNYKWLLDDDQETPRTDFNPIDTNRNMGQSNRKLLGQKSDRFDQPTLSSSDNKMYNNNYKIKSKQQSTQLENFSETIESQRQTQDGQQFMSNGQNHANLADDSNQTRNSIVKKSLNNVKNMIRMAADGLRPTSGMDLPNEGYGLTESRQSIRLRNKAQKIPEISHEQVELDLESMSSDANVMGDQFSQKSQRQLPHGPNSFQWAQNNEKSITNEMIDQNPLDDDSN